MNLDALKEALAQIDAEWPVVDVAAMNMAFAAARAVLDSEEAWWCETHNTSKDRQHNEDAPPWRWQSTGSCSMVRVRLLAEEKTPRFDPMSDPTYDPDHVTPGGSP